MESNEGVAVLLLLVTAGVLGLLVGWRMLRMLGFMQQKEYRLDRWWLFWQSPEGRNEFWKIVPLSSELQWRLLKRPKVTVHILIVAVVAVVLLLGAAVAVWVTTDLLFNATGIGSQLLGVQLATILTGVLMLILIPAVVGLASIPTTLLRAVIVWVTLWRAAVKVRRHRPVIIGITGSYGKTSCKFITAAMLQTAGSVYTTPASYNTAYSVARSILKSYTGEQYMVLEYGAYTRREIGRLARRFRPSVAVITGLTEQHLGLFGSLQNIAQAKSELIQALPPGGNVFYNADDAQVQQILEAADRVDVVLHACSSKDLEPKLNKSGELSLVLDKKRVSTQLVGVQYASAVALGMAVAREIGVTIAQVEERLRGFKPGSRFLSTYRLASGAQVIDDGGSCNPVGFRSVIALAASLSGSQSQRKVLITAGIIDLAEREDAVHAELAIQAHDVFDEVWYVGVAGRAAFQRVFGSKLIWEQSEVQAAVQTLTKHDVVVIEGRMPGWVQPMLTPKLVPQPPQ